jgi:alpha-tubulin suppressor-like RCC1 family protein
VPVDVIGLTVNIIDLTTGYHHTCGLTSTGGIKCWGDNEYGQLGDGTWGNDRTTPVDVIGLSTGVSAFAAGGYHTCSQSTAGGIKCWGANWFGQLGDGTTMDRSTPVNVVGLSSGMTSIDAGYAHACSLTSDGGAKCWGMNGFGTLGDGAEIYRTIPVDVIGLEEGVNIITVGWSHICALTPEGGVKCWGAGPAVGDGTNISRNTPVDVIGLSSGVKIIDAGGYHTCSVSVVGGVKCWGQNYEGVLGDGTTINRNTPVDVIGLSSGIGDVSAGTNHTCALTVNGGVKCWGWNGSGELGDGTTNQSTTPVDVVGMSNGVSALSAGRSHTCTLSETGGVKCWGDNEYGQLGDGTTDDKSTPVDVLGLSSGVKAISAGVNHTCVLTEAGGVKCWGNNEYGQLGDSTSTNKLTPVEMSGMSAGVMAVTSGYKHTCILTTGGGVKCTGANESGQLGNGTLNGYLSPIDVIGMSSGAIAINAGFAENTCVLVGSGRPKCWGADSWGQLGVGTVINRLTPVDVIESPTPSLVTNYSNGQPGSSITITGWDFPPESEATLTINGEVQSSTVSVSPTGSFIVFLDTTGSDEGSYFITASVNPSATVSFILGDGAPLRIQEGGGQTFEVPTGIAYDDFVFLPVVRR